MIQDYEETDYCPFCGEETLQKFHWDGDERDSNGSSQTCLTCKCVKYGFSSEWTKPYISKESSREAE